MSSKEIKEEDVDDFLQEYIQRTREEHTTSPPPCKEETSFREGIKAEEVSHLMDHSHDGMPSIRKASEPSQFIVSTKEIKEEYLEGFNQDTPLCEEEFCSSLKDSDSSMGIKKEEETYLIKNDNDAMVPTVPRRAGITMHASKVPHKRDKKPSRACPNNCGFTIADRDPHRECTICLGYGHAQEAVEAGNCKDCQCLSASKLRSRLAFMEQLEHQDDEETADKLLEPMTRGDEADLPLSSEQMDESGPSPVVTDDPDAMSQAAPEPEVEEEPLSGTEATLHQACKRAAEKLGLSWPALPPPAKRSRLDGCFLPKATPTRQQRLPVFPDVMEDLTMSWKTPYYTKSLFDSFTMLDMDGMEELGWGHMPPVEPSLANHLAPPSGNRTANAAPKMPNKDNRYISLLWEKTYKTAALTGRALNASSLLMAYLADLQEEMSTALQEGRPTEETWTEIRTVTDLVLRISRCSAQSIGRIMGLAVVGNRNLWLNLSSASDKDKIVVLNHPLSPDGLFGSATTAVLEKFEPRQQAALKPNRSVGPQQRIHQKQQQQQQQRPHQLHQQRPHQQQYPRQQQLHPRHQKQHPRHQQHPRQQHREGTPTYTHQARAATSTDQWPAVNQRSGSWDRTHEEDTEFHRPLASIEDRMRYAVLSKLHQTSYDN